MGIRILKGGMLTTVQDLGRTGYQSQGFSVAGVMDVRSFKIANLLLDNPENEAVLEFTLIGPTLQFTSATIIAITGGDFQPTVNGDPVPMYTALYMNKGDILKFGSARTGSRGYVAFSSYLDIPVVMGSRCTNLKSKQGGFKGRKLKEGDYINFRIKRRYLRWKCFRIHTGAVPWKADHSSGRPPDYRRIRKDCHSGICGYTKTGAEKDRSQSKISGNFRSGSTASVYGRIERAG